MGRQRDYYEILGVPRTATRAEIRSAYRKLIREFHPDVNPSADALERTKAINAAYEVLSDPDRRATYDWQSGYRQSPPPRPKQTYTQAPPPSSPGYRPPPRRRTDPPPRRAYTPPPRPHKPPPRPPDPDEPTEAVYAHPSRPRRAEVYSSKPATVAAEKRLYRALSIATFVELIVVAILIVPLQAWAQHGIGVTPSVTGLTMMALGGLVVPSAFMTWLIFPNFWETTHHAIRRDIGILAGSLSILLVLTGLTAFGVIYGHPIVLAGYGCYLPPLLISYCAAVAYEVREVMIWYRLIRRLSS